MCFVNQEKVYSRLNDEISKNSDKFKDIKLLDTSNVWCRFELRGPLSHLVLQSATNVGGIPVL